VQGTPAIYVNGIPVPPGAVPYAVIAGMIDEELERAGSR
jgi:protein-disulfide isomerase